jgi:PAS domain S-box-containing protein
MASAELDELVRSCQELPVPAILTTLETHKYVGVNDGAAALFGAPAADLIGDDVLCHIDARDREASRLAYAALAARVIDGYQVHRRIVTPDGTVVSLSVWGRRVEAGGQLYGMWVLGPASAPAIAVETLVAGASDVVLAVTDHDWLIEYMNADAHILGVTGSELRGFPLLGLVHPSAASEFLAAARRAAVDHLGVTVFTRMRVGQDGWAERHCYLVPVCEHEPPRLGVVISPGTLPTADGSSGGQLDEQVRHAALEARANRALSALPALAHLPRGSELSVRQTEIVARLVAGESTSDIAQAMFLSPSTVRNHLVAVYRKFGVHSQAELLAALLRGFVDFRG